MGGKVGLKGTDGEQILQYAIQLGALAQSEEKTEKALEILTPLKNEFILITCPGEMGEYLSGKLGYHPVVLNMKKKHKTSGEDTRDAARLMKQMDVDLLVFTGGDGTARDVYHAIDTTTPALGIPAGVKIQSPVFATSPQRAGELIRKFIKGERLQIKEQEVMDLDEDLYRKEILHSRLYGYLNVLYDHQYIQGLKAGSQASERYKQDAIAADIVEGMNPDVVCLLGPGSTTLAITERLKLKGSLLGVDILQNNKILKKDVSEKDILQVVSKHRVKLIITPVGGQGYLLGRGNHQLSAEVLKNIPKDQIQIVSTQQKIIDLHQKSLLIDVGDDEVNHKLSGYYKIVTGYHESMMYKVAIP